MKEMEEMKEMKEIDKGTLKEMIEGRTEKGHSEAEIMECIRKMVGAKPKEKDIVKPKAYSR